MPYNAEKRDIPPSLVQPPLGQACPPKLPNSATPKSIRTPPAHIRWFKGWEAENVSIEQEAQTKWLATFHISAKCKMGDHHWVNLRLAVDTGATHCAINCRAVSFELTRALSTKINACGVDGKIIAGGDREVRLNLQCHAWQEKQCVPIGLPTAFVVHDLGEMEVDGLVSLRWCAERGIRINPQHHILEIHDWTANPLVKIPTLAIPLDPTASLNIPGLPDPVSGILTDRQCEIRRWSADKKHWKRQKSLLGKSMLSILCQNPPLRQAAFVLLPRRKVFPTHLKIPRNNRIMLWF